jgi:hypothetical protein
VLTVRILPFAVICILSGTIAFAESQQTQQKPSDHKKTTASDKRGTDDSPLIIKVLPSKEAESAAKDDREEKAAKRKTDEDLATYTGKLATYTKVLVGIGAVQCLIFIAQCVIFVRQERTAKVIERAYVFVNVKIVGRVVSTPSGLLPSDFMVNFCNLGKTPAIIKMLSAHSLIATGIFPVLPEGGPSEERFEEGLVIAAGEWREVPLRFNISDSQMGEIERGESILFICGRIEYKDILRTTRKTGYCWQYRPYPENFIFSHASKLNYYT